MAAHTAERVARTLSTRLRDTSSRQALLPLSSLCGHRALSRLEACAGSTSANAARARPLGFAPRFAMAAETAASASRGQAHDRAGHEKRKQHSLGARSAAHVRQRGPALARVRHSPCQRLLVRRLHHVGRCVPHMRFSGRSPENSTFHVWQTLSSHHGDSVIAFLGVLHATPSLPNCLVVLLPLESSFVHYRLPQAASCRSSRSTSPLWRAESFNMDCKRVCSPGRGLLCTPHHSRAVHASRACDYTHPAAT